MEFLSTFERLYGKEFCTINLHLHAHLSECILQYGPVYSFWLFAFERMNGILGSFQTNSVDISVQLMHRFLNIHTYSERNWPDEFKSEFSVLIDRCQYNKGSLSQVQFSKLVNSETEIRPLPPVHESALQNHEKSEISRVVGVNSFDVFTLYEKCGAIRVGRFTIGSKSSRFTTVSIVKVRTLQSDKLAEIQHFARCTIKLGDQIKLVWLVAVSLFPEHSCRVWFGSPTEVWGGVPDSDIHYMPLSALQNRVTFSKCTYNFGRVIGTDKVMVITPLH